jgi:hypothetical protein
MTDEAAKGPTEPGLSEQLSSPAATGGEGVFFEQHVGAYWLAQLLVQSIPPILTDALVVEVHFQTENLGYHTDDILVVCERLNRRANLVVQAKRTFTVSASDEQCQKAIGDFWKDYTRANPFNQNDDRLVLVTLRGTNVLLDHFSGLLDAARAAASANEFERRLSLKGFISRKSIKQCDDIRQIISDVDGRPIGAKEIWPFLRVLHVISLDLHTSTSQTEAHIKTLLAMKSTATNPVAVAATTWNALLALASIAAPGARALRRSDLAPELLADHDPVGTEEQRVLAALKSHTDIVLGRIRTTIGAVCHLRRDAMIQRVLEAVASHQVVLVTGPAGSGKSVIAKRAAEFLLHDHFAFGFRVEEFARAHIDETLHASQIPATAARMQAILAAQDRKLLVVESVERLLEKPTRDAFSDLMMLTASDEGLGIVMTCRDYSVEQVRASFLIPAGINHTVIEVPPLDDDELAEIEVVFPSLAVPLAHPALRNILRNPYFIDKALSIPWSVDHPLPASERGFRALFWRQIVRAEDRPSDGMPQRRANTLQEIAVRRARALTDYVTSADLDAAAIVSLIQDSLIVSPDARPSAVATGHDVLEDWAILHWIEEQHLADDTSFYALAHAIGPHPSIRRSYRKWVAELVDRGSADANRLFTSALSLTNVPAQFRDDTLVSLLRAPSAPDFLEAHEAELVGNNGSTLKRVVHLLRVACVTSPEWLAGMRGQGSILNVPEGSAWAAVLSLVHRNIGSFAPEDRPSLLALIEDGVRGVSWQAPNLDGGQYVAAIGYWLLPLFGGYRSDDSRKRVLKVIAKLPKEDPVRFEAVLRGQVRNDNWRDHTADEFRELLLSGLEGFPTARDLPNLLIAIATETFLASEETLRPSEFGRSSLDVSLQFGIKDNLRFEFFPASALRGPWIHLLASHPREGLDFLVKVFNHSIDWYVHPRVPDPFEDAWEVELTFSDGATRKQWVNPRLWGLYRGFTVGPYVLQSLLMALESWLLRFAKEAPDDLDGVLASLLKQTDSAALSAVVSSVAIAHPHNANETLLALLSVPDYVIIDRSRMANEHGVRGINNFLPSLRTDHKMYESERKQADGLPHRRRDLESAVSNLQFGPSASRVHELIDQHLSDLPPVDMRDEDDLTWQLALFRMDLRQYNVVDDHSDQEELSSSPDSEAPARTVIRLEPKAAPPEIQQLIDDSAKTHGAMSARLGIHLWGMNAFKRDFDSADASLWNDNLAAAQLMDVGGIHLDSTHNAPGFIAAVCVRDHWDDMSSEQKNWCVDVVCAEVTKHADRWGSIERVQRFPMAADRPCASVIPNLLRRPLTGDQRARVSDAFITALTHPIDEVGWYAISGIDEDYWAADPATALRLVNAIATEALVADQAWLAEQQRPYYDRVSSETISGNAARSVRQNFHRAGFVTDDAYTRLDASGPYGTGATLKILTLLGQIPADPLAVSAFAQASAALVRSWGADRHDSKRRDRNFEEEQAISDCIQKMVMRASLGDASSVLKPILDALDEHPREIHNVIQGLTNSEDNRPNTVHYWALWGLFAERVKRATWLRSLDQEHPYGGEVLSTIFLTAWWKENVRHWRSLEGHAHNVDRLFDALPPSWIVLDSYIRFLYHIGERSLPSAFTHIASSLGRGNVQDMLRSSNTVFMLEVLLQRHVYGRPLELKRNSDLRVAVLLLLDTLVEVGSSAAFRMRDDFVTPAI